MNIIHLSCNINSTSVHSFYWYLMSYQNLCLIARNWLKFSQRVILFHIISTQKPISFKVSARLKAQLNQHSLISIFSLCLFRNFVLNLSIYFSHWLLYVIEDKKKHNTSTQRCEIHLWCSCNDVSQLTETLYAKKKLYLWPRKGHECGMENCSGNIYALCSSKRRRCRGTFEYAVDDNGLCVCVCEDPKRDTWMLEFVGMAQR